MVVNEAAKVVIINELGIEYLHLVPKKGVFRAFFTIFAPDYDPKIPVHSVFAAVGRVLLVQKVRPRRCGD